MMDTAKKGQSVLMERVVHHHTHPSGDAPRRLRAVQPPLATAVAASSDVVLANTRRARLLDRLRGLFGHARPARLATSDFTVSRRMFLAETQRDLGSALCAIETGDFAIVLEVARRFKREGFIYDFPRIGQLGDALARAILNQDVRAARASALLVMKYLGIAMDQLPARDSGETKPQ